MRVDFYGIYRLIAAGKTFEYSVNPGDTLIDLLHMLTSKFPPLQAEFFDEHGNLFPYIPIYINGRNPRLLEKGDHTIIEPQDVVSIFSPISSGRINVEDINKTLSA